MEKNDNIEKVHLQFLKRILNVRTSTPNFLVYGELGGFRVEIDIKCRMLSFWSRLVTTDKLSSKMYNFMYQLYHNGNHDIVWINSIKKIFDDIGLSFIFSSQVRLNPQWIKIHVKQILRDQFVQKWRSDLANTSRGYFYSILKQEFVLEPYLTRIDKKYSIFLTKFRLCNFKFPIETGRWRKINREHRLCTLCSRKEIGDEFHYLFLCSNPEILEYRRKFIPNYYTINSSLQKMAGMLALCHTELMKNLALFLENISKYFK